MGDLHIRGENGLKGVCLTENGALALREFPVPPVTEGMVKIRTRFAGVCSTDVGYWKNGSEKLCLPVILGHEMSGVIEETAPDVTEFRVGDRVIVTNDYHLCGKCRFCRRGQINMCVERRSIGSAENGAMAEFMVVPARMVLHLPDAVSFEEGALAEVIACGVHAMEQMAHAQPGQVVLVMGPGIMGITAAMAAQAMGCTVVLAGLSRDAGRLDFARQLRIPYVIDTEKEDLPALLYKLTDGYGADIAAECTGSYGGLETCFRLTAKCGTVVQIAIPHGRHETDISPVIKKELRYVGSYAKAMSDWMTTLRLMEEGKLDCRLLISEKLPLERYEEAFTQTAEAKAFKILFDLNE